MCRLGKVFHYIRTYFIVNQKLITWHRRTDKTKLGNLYYRSMLPTTSSYANACTDGQVSIDKRTSNDTDNCNQEVSNESSNDQTDDDTFSGILT